MNKYPLIYTKETWLKLRDKGVVSFTDEEINSGKIPFKEDSFYQYAIDRRYDPIAAKYIGKTLQYEQKT